VPSFSDTGTVLQQRTHLTKAFTLFERDAQSMGFMQATLRFYCQRLGLFFAYCTQENVLHIGVLRRPTSGARVGVGHKRTSV